MGICAKVFTICHLQSQSLPFYCQKVASVTRLEKLLDLRLNTIASLMRFCCSLYLLRECFSRNILRQPGHGCDICRTQPRLWQRFGFKVLRKRTQFMLLTPHRRSNNTKYAVRLCRARSLISGLQSGWQPPAPLQVWTRKEIYRTAQRLACLLTLLSCRWSHTVVSGWT